MNTPLELRPGFPVRFDPHSRRQETRPLRAEEEARQGRAGCSSALTPGRAKEHSSFKPQALRTPNRGQGLD